MNEKTLEPCQLRRVFQLACEQDPPIAHAHMVFGEEGETKVQCSMCGFDMMILQEGSGSIWVSHIQMQHPESHRIIQKMIEG